MIAYNGDEDIYNGFVDEVLNVLFRDRTEEQHDYINEFKDELISTIAYIYNDTDTFRDFVDRLSIYVDQVFED